MAPAATPTPPNVRQRNVPETEPEREREKERERERVRERERERERERKRIRERVVLYNPLVPRTKFSIKDYFRKSPHPSISFRCTC